MAQNVIQDAVLTVQPLGFPWQTPDPFLFCVHHDDRYPAGNEHLGPVTSLEGRSLGQDFGGKDGWSMYHGMRVPGFPQHPHRGFETITIVRKGLLDHSDSLGAAARFGGGDVQWLTAGGGILHSEMFPLLKRDEGNHTELFQIWLNLPHRDKMVEPHFSMLWAKDIPHRQFRDDGGGVTDVTVVAGKLVADAKAPNPPPKSWASGADTDVAILTLKLSPGAKWTLPAAAAGTNRSLYFFAGKAMKIAGRDVSVKHVLTLKGDREVSLQNGEQESELLLLQGRPIKEPVVQHGPFVMTSRAEIQQAFFDYQRTQFGGWPWKSNDPTHPREEGRFARHADGRIERPA